MLLTYPKEGYSDWSEVAMIASIWKLIWTLGVKNFVKILKTVDGPTLDQPWFKNSSKWVGKIDTVKDLFTFLGHFGPLGD